MLTVAGDVVLVGLGSLVAGSTRNQLMGERRLMLGGIRVVPGVVGVLVFLK
jgi:hypothetical protein